MSEKENVNDNLIEKCQQNFLKNNFNFTIVDEVQEAKDLVINKMIPELGIKSASWGDSLTLMESGILEILANLEEIDFIQTFDTSIPREEVIQKVGREHQRARAHAGCQPFGAATMVRSACSSVNTWALRGRGPWPATITRQGFRLPSGRGQSDGSSCRTVPAPTMTASAARRMA